MDKALPLLTAARFSGSNQSNVFIMIHFASEKAGAFETISAVKRLFGSKNGGGMLNMDRGVSPGILTSKELLLSLAGSEVSIGRYAIREKNLTEVVETI